MLVPGQQLKLDEDTRKMLGRKLIDLTMELEDQHAPFLRNLDTWWQWHDAKPLVERRSDPWDGASNIVVPLIRWHSDANVSRTLNGLFATDQFWMGKTRNKEVRHLIQPWVEFQNAAGNGNEFDLFMPIVDWVTELNPIGRSILGLNWVERRRHIFVPGEGGRPKPQTVVLSKGPRIEQIPADQVLWQMNRPIHESEIVIRQSLMTYSEIVKMGQFGDWDTEVIEKLKGRHTSPDGRQERVRRTIREAEGLQNSGPQAYAPHDIRECWIEWPMLQSMGIEIPGQSDPDTPILPLVVTLHKDSGEILRVIAKPYLIEGWPFYDGYYRRESGRNNSAGLSKILDHLQRGATAIVNQAIDGVTLSNSLNYVTTDRRLLDQDWMPNRGLFLDNLNEFREIQFSKLITPDLALLNMLLGMAERLTGTADANLGRETRLGGHPSPATNTLAQLQEGSHPRKKDMKVLRAPLARLGEDITTLYQQFEDNADGKIEALIGEEDAAKAMEFLSGEHPGASTLKMDIRALSEESNPATESQKALLMGQATAQYMSQVLQMLQIAENPKAPPGMKEFALKGINGLTESYKRILEANQVDEIEDFVVKLKESNGDSRVISELGDQAAGTLQQLLAGNQIGQVPATPVSPQGVPLGANGGGSSTGFGS